MLHLVGLCSQNAEPNILHVGLKFLLFLGLRSKLLRLPGYYMHCLLRRVLTLQVSGLFFYIFPDWNQCIIGRCCRADS